MMCICSQIVLNVRWSMQVHVYWCTQIRHSKHRTEHWCVQELRFCLTVYSVLPSDDETIHNVSSCRLTCFWFNWRLCLCLLLIIFTLADDFPFSNLISSEMLCLWPSLAIPPYIYPCTRLPKNSNYTELMHPISMFCYLQWLMSRSYPLLTTSWCLLKTCHL